MDSNKRILIHLHLYYVDMWEKIRTYLTNLQNYPYDLYVTTPTPDDILRHSILSFAPLAKIIKVENLGYDIAPFFHVLNSVDLSEYSYVVKLHTKRDMPGDTYISPLPYNYGFANWRNYLLNVFQYEHIQTSIKAMEQDDALGMVADYRLIYPRVEKRMENTIKWWLQKMKLPSKGTRYVMGSMFLCKAALLAPIKRLNIQPTDFAPPDDNHSENIAHVMERLLGAIVQSQDYRIADVFTSRFKQNMWLRMLRKFLLFLFYRKRKSDGSCIIKVCKIPIYRKKGTIK